MSYRNSPKLDVISLFWLGYILYFISRYMQYTSTVEIDVASKIFEYGKICAYFLMIVSYMLSNPPKTKIKVKRFLAIIILLCILIYQFVANNENALLVIALISLAYKGEDTYKFLKRNYYLHLIMFCTVLLLYFLGIISDNSNELIRWGNSIRRSSLGFQYSGQLQISITTIILFHCYLNHKKTGMTYVLYFIVSIIIYIFSRTIMPLFISTLAILIFINYDKINIKKLKKNKVIDYFPILCAFVTFVFTYLLSLRNPIAIIADNIVHNRFSLNITAMYKYGITMFGTGFKNFTDSGGQYLYVDSEYMYLLISNGIIYFIFAIVMIIFTIRYYRLNGDCRVVLILMLLCINSIVNNGIISSTMNPFSIVMLPVFITFMSSKNIRRKSLNGKSFNYNSGL